MIHHKHLEEEERWLPDYYCVDKAAAGVCTWAEFYETQGWPHDDNENQRAAAATKTRHARQKTAAV
jgi:ParB family transcriptional regulator, chromosome partitioning protein